MLFMGDTDTNTHTTKSMHTHPKTENLKREKAKEIFQAYMDQKKSWNKNIIQNRI